MYASAGLYTVSLTVSEEDGDNDTETKFPYIIVDDSMPNASFTYSPSNLLESDQATFDASSSTGYDEPLSYSWDFGDDAFGEGVSPAHAYAQDGNYLVTLTVTDADESTDSISQTITVADTAQVADFSANATSGPEPLTVSFTDTSTSYDGIDSWSWDFGDGETSNQQNPSHTYTQDGVYTVELTVYEADGDNSTETKVDYIIVSEGELIAGFTASSTSGPEPLTVSFTDLSVSYDGITSWTWNFEDGETSSEQNPTHMYAADGTYTVSLTVIEADGNNDVETKASYITVTDSTPLADFSYLPNPAALTIDFTDQSTSYDELVSWAWDFGDGEISAMQNPTHKFPDNGTFSVSLTVTDADGSVDAITKQVLTYLPNSSFELPFPLFVVLVIAMIGFIISLGILFMRKL
jgi:PKD repeat protein